MKWASQFNIIFIIDSPLKCHFRRAEHRPLAIPLIALIDQNVQQSLIWLNPNDTWIMDSPVQFHFPTGSTEAIIFPIDTFCKGTSKAHSIQVCCQFVPWFQIYFLYLPIGSNDKTRSCGNWSKCSAIINLIKPKRYMNNG
jgi:hypothetical protein